MSLLRQSALSFEIWQMGTLPFAPITVIFCNIAHQLAFAAIRNTGDPRNPETNSELSYSASNKCSLAPEVPASVRWRRRWAERRRKSQLLQLLQS